VVAGHRRPGDVCAFGVIYFSPITPPALYNASGGAITAFWLFAFLGFLPVGLVLTLLRPRNPIGWLASRKATLRVRVDAEGVRRYPQDVEATVYFCVLEALQNVQKHAHASEVVVRLRDEETLAFEVADDGSGFEPATVRSGTGLTNMNDRMDALGGSIQLSSQPGEGTCVRGALPAPVLASAPP
jgi:hypothetical protein